MQINCNLSILFFKIDAIILKIVHYILNFFRRTGMSRKKRRFKGNLFFSEHHLTPKSEGGKGKDKKRVLHSKHVAWHTLVKNSPPDKAAKILSCWIRRDSRFFALTKGESIYKTVQEINHWLKDDDVKIKVVFKRSKIIRFHPLNYTSILPKIVS